MESPHFKMLWAERIPTSTASGTTVSLVAGTLKGCDVPSQSPPPASWAADPRNGVVIATIKMEPGAHYVLPQASLSPLRVLLCPSVATDCTTG